MATASATFFAKQLTDLELEECTTPFKSVGLTTINGLRCVSGSNPQAVDAGKAVREVIEKFVAEVWG